MRLSVLFATVFISACGGGTLQSTDAAGGGGGTDGRTSDSGGSGGSGGSSGSGGSGGSMLIPADRTTTWEPGILSDMPLGLPLGTDGLPQRTTVCATVNPGGNIQAAIDSCPANQVVLLGAGTFDIGTTIQLKSNVVLRGAASGTGGTIINKTNGGTVLAIGSERDQICYSGNGQGHALTADAGKESRVLTLGSAASTFNPGDLVWIDQLDVSPV